MRHTSSRRRSGLGRTAYRGAERKPKPRRNQGERVLPVATDREMLPEVTPEQAVASMLVTRSQIARRFNVSGAAVGVLARRALLPEPVGRLWTGEFAGRNALLYDARAVEAAVWKHRPKWLAK